MVTYSTGTPPTNATKLQDFNSVLNILPDNTSKLIAPKDVRDAVFTTWENIAFKPTTVGDNEYIGIDQDYLKEKILIGKKSVGGQPIMNSTLLNTEVDIFFYNTKSEPQSNYHTTVAFLAGTGSNTNSGQIFAPYLKSTVVVNPGYSNTLDFDIFNPTFYTIGTGTFSGGNINVRSQYGSVTINGLRMPTFLENSVGSAYDGFALKYKWVSGQPFAVWEQIASASTTDTVFSTGTVSITGNPVILNGHPINFTSTVPVPTNVGGVISGTTFSNMPLTEVVRMILYPYIAPVLTTSMTFPLIEIGDTITAGLQRMTYTVTRNSTYSITSFTSNPAYTSSLPQPGNIQNGTITGQIQPTINMSTIQTGTTSNVIFSRTTQLTDSFPSTASSVSTFRAVLPWFFGSSTISSTSSFGLNSINNILGTSSNPVLGRLTKIIASPATFSSSSFNKTFTLSTNGLPLNRGFLYFGYPSDYAPLTSILDPNGFEVIYDWSTFTISNVQSANSFWSGKQYRFYIFVGSTGSTSPILTTVGSAPSFSGSFQFKFA